MFKNWYDDGFFFFFNTILTKKFKNTQIIYDSRSWHVNRRNGKHTLYAQSNVKIYYLCFASNWTIL